LAEALAKGQARHLSVKKNRAAIDDIRQTYRRSGGETARLKLDDLTAWYERELAGITSMDEFRNTRLFLNRDEFVPRDVREKYAALPDSVVIRDREVDIEYDVEDEGGARLAVARLRLPEKLARGLSEAELPVLDRPLRFVVIRGQRGALRANTLDDLQEALDAPWSPDEIENPDEGDEHASHDENRARELAADHRRGTRGRHRPGRDSRGGGNRRGHPGGGPNGKGSKPRRGGGSGRKFRGR
jgi:ATP-dependent helicase HrpA